MSSYLTRQACTYYLLTGAALTIALTTCLLTPYSLGVPDDDSWPLALEPDVVTPAAYRSVVTCRVHRTVEVCGAPYPDPNPRPNPDPDPDPNPNPTPSSP